MNDERTFSAQGQRIYDANREAGSNSLGNTLDSSQEPKVKNPRDFDNALYAALLSRAHSDQARALVDAVTNMIAGHELVAGTRTNKRKKKEAALSSAVERLLADLLLAQTSQTAKGYVYRSMRPEGFTDNEVGYRTFRRAVVSLVELEFIEPFRGFQARGAFGPYIRKATRYRATKKLLGLCDQHGVRVIDFHQHFFIPLPKHPLQLRAASKRNQYGDKIRGKLIRFKATALTEKLEKELKELNSFFDGFELRGGIHRGYLRVFNNGDHPKFDWSMGGRLYSYGEANYQQMERADRLRITINGERVCEIDIRASYLTIFHALYGEDFDATKDPYDMRGLGPEVRDVVKMWVTASFGNNAPIAKWPKELVTKYRERTGKMLGKHYSASKVRDKVLKAYPLLVRLGETVDGRERGWAELMFIESQAMCATTLELMDEQIPSLAVHDSIIVPLSMRHKATAVLTKWYKKFANATPVLVTHFPDGYIEPPLVHGREAVDHGSGAAHGVTTAGSINPQGQSASKDILGISSDCCVVKFKNHLKNAFQ